MEQTRISSMMSADIACNNSPTLIISPTPFRRNSLQIRTGSGARHVALSVFILHVQSLLFQYLFQISIKLIFFLNLLFPAFFLKQKSSCRILSILILAASGYRTWKPAHIRKLYTELTRPGNKNKRREKTLQTAVGQQVITWVIAQTKLPMTFTAMWKGQSGTNN